MAKKYHYDRARKKVKETTEQVKVETNIHQFDTYAAMISFVAERLGPRIDVKDRASLDKCDKYANGKTVFFYTIHHVSDNTTIDPETGRIVADSGTHNNVDKIVDEKFKTSHIST